ncbi:MAG: hypothetical protein MUR14_06485 [Schleiferiaceae bacterium]|jgi:hypothetical protein|nr:AtpZ/AtpI family protein [Flavobacteriales bacterium]MDO7567147.1 hypothetical protein [Schleiferiaceae bacterium]NCF57511.1 hypothetical protein [Bacteroidota bacterium]NCG43681.1 hypothetical protein [Pseudomonadota bacterium]
MRFSGMAVQMAATIGLMTWLGSLLDSDDAQTPYGAASGALIGCLLALYRTLKDVTSHDS